MDTLYVRVNALNANESFLRGLIGAYAARKNPTIEVISDIKTAVSEAVTNAIVHAYSCNEDGEIIVSADIKGDILSLEIADKGVGIPNVEEALKDFYTTKASEERSGLGFTIMNSFMDTLEVFSELGEGTIVRMTKRLAG